MERRDANPWEEIPLADYENHMRLDSVGQLQALNALMARQFALGPAETVMVLGVAGGNGLEHAEGRGFRKVYGVDVNRDYLRACEERYPGLRGVLECVCADLTDPAAALPQADLLVADLLVEYVGCACFLDVVRRVAPQHVSCVIQVDADAGFVSDSPYLHAFDGLDEVHRRVDEADLEAGMLSAGYRRTGRTELPLPNGKRLVQLDFAVRPKNIVFDLGGVLFARDISRCPQDFVDFFAFVRAERMPHFWEEYDRGVLTLEEVTDELCRLNGCPRSRCEEYLQRSIDLQRPVAPTERLVGELKASGYRLFVLSNMSAEYIEFLRRFPVYGLFDGEVVSCEEHTVKPERRIYEILLERYGLRPAETLFVDDRPANIEAAEALGIRGRLFDFRRPAEACDALRRELLPQ